MSKAKRTIAVTLAIFASAFAGAIAADSPANAASSPIEACGGGSYHVIDHHDLGTYATIYLLYNGSYNCVVTWKKSPYAGNSVTVLASLVRAPGGSGNTFTDEGPYHYYAGPVKAKAPGVCIWWSGAYGNDGWGSGWSHCG